MAIPANAGTATSTAKISDINALITVINTELGLYATKASVDANTARLKTLEDKIPDLAPASSVISVQNELPRIKSDSREALDRVVALEAEPNPVIPPDLSDRVAALEEALAGLRAPPPVATAPTVSPIPHRRRDVSEGPELIYDKATLYLGDMELHALRIAENTWRLAASLNYITVNQIQWTYDETVTGTSEEVYAHALRRLEELAELKPQHDAVHARVREMSEGKA